MKREDLLQLLLVKGTFHPLLCLASQVFLVIALAAFVLLLLTAIVKLGGLCPTPSSSGQAEIRLDVEHNS